MKLRSLLFVPGDRPDRMEKAAGLEADALILDLEDAVSLENKASAREHVAAFLLKPRKPGLRLIVRINPLDSGLTEADLGALLSTGPDAIMLPKANGASAVAETLTIMKGAGRSLPILPLTVETPDALFTLGEYQMVKEHLYGLTWGAEDLSAALGAKSSRDEYGALREPLRLARAMTLFAARAAVVPAIETVYADFKNEDGLKLAATQAAKDGFSGMLAIHPLQVPIINEAFTPGAEELARAEEIVAAFADNPGQGALQIRGKMIDAAHLKLARAVIERSS